MIMLDTFSQKIRLFFLWKVRYQGPLDRLLRQSSQFRYFWDNTSGQTSYLYILTLYSSNCYQAIPKLRQKRSVPPQQLSNFLL
jgi:hypothetical protein